MNDTIRPEDNYQNGLVTKALDAITDAYKIGGYLLAAMLAGTGLMALAAVLGQGWSIMMWTGAGTLGLSMAIVTFLYVKPFRDLKRKLDEKSEFLNVSQDGVVRMAATVRDFSGGIAENHVMAASALRALRPYLDQVQVVANWIDSAQDLSADLIRHAIALRDASNSIEVAFSTGDAQRLRQSLEEAQRLAEQIRVAAGPKRIIERLDLAGERIEDVAKNEKVQQLIAALQLGMMVLEKMPAPVGKIGASLDELLPDIAKAVRDAGAGDIVAGYLRRATAGKSAG